MTSISQLRGLSSTLGAKTPCRVATTENITLEGLQTIDGISVTAGDRIVVRAQTNATENGIYEADTGNWVRAADFDGDDDIVDGTLVVVRTGDTYGNFLLKVEADGEVSLGTTEISFQAIVSFNELPIITSLMLQLLDDTTAEEARATIGAAGRGANSDITSLAGLTTPLTVAQGGIGAAALTANALLVGNGASAVAALPPSGAGNIVAVTNDDAYGLRAAIPQLHHESVSGSATYSASGIPSWARRIIVTLNAISGSGTGTMSLVLREGGVDTIAGYTSGAGMVYHGLSTLSNSHTEIPLQGISPLAGDTHYGTVVFDYHGSGPTWTYFGAVHTSGTEDRVHLIAGSVTLGTAPDGVTLKIDSGTFDNGSWAVSYM